MVPGRHQDGRFRGDGTVTADHQALWAVVVQHACLLERDTAALVVVIGVVADLDEFGAHLDLQEDHVGQVRPGGGMELVRVRDGHVSFLSPWKFVSGDLRGGGSGAPTSSPFPT